MTQPRRVSRSGRHDVPGVEFCTWNALVAIGFSELSELSAVQRVAALALRYHGEVMNGGHFQYFCNRSEFDHHEVLAALRGIGAEATAAVLADAIAHVGNGLRSPPVTISGYLAAEAESGMEDLDTRFYQVEPQFNQALERYLEKHELEFVSWVE